MTKDFLTTYQRFIRWLPILVVLLFCTACGPYQLARRVDPPVYKTSDQQQLDNLICKEQANREANSPGMLVGAFFSGLTVVGLPIFIAVERDVQRNEYVKCMRGRGYNVTPVDDNDAPKQASAPADTGSSARDDVTKKMENLKSMRDRGLITEEEYNGKKKEMLDRM